MGHSVNTRQQKFIQAKLEGKSNAQAAREAGYSESVARVAGRKILDNPRVQAKLQQLMERAGLTDERLSAAINSGPNRDRVAQIQQLEWHVRRIMQSLILDLAAGNTHQALFSIRRIEKILVEKILEPKAAPRPREITIEELRRKIELLQSKASGNE